MVLTTRDGQVGEVATIGNEGAFGVVLLLGADRALYDAFAQIPGPALRMPAEAFRREAMRGGAFGQRVERYSLGFIHQISQSVVCNLYHPIQQRMCRWLLMTQDRVGKDVFALTQEFLAQMLGVRRPSVSVVAGLLQRQGIIDYRRGYITVRDREPLESSECGCHRIVRDESERIFTKRPRARPRVAR